MARVLERRPAMRITGATSELPPAVAKLWVGYPGTGPALHKSWLCFTVAPRSEFFLLFADRILGMHVWASVPLLSGMQLYRPC